MNGWDILLLLLVAAALGFAVRHVLMNRRRGKGCGCGCEACPDRWSCGGSRGNKK